MSASVWIVVMMFGLVVRTLGPLPYDDVQCERQKAEMAAQIDQKYEADKFLGNKLPQLKGRTVERSDITLECRMAPDAPAIELNPE